MKKKFQILVAEDSDKKFTLIEFDISQVFGSDAEITRVKTLAELERVFSERSNEFTFIILDASLEDGATLMFLDDEIRLNFKKPVVANSSSRRTRESQMEYGCTHEGGPRLYLSLESIKQNQQ